DSDGKLLHRNYAPDQLKLISRDPESINDVYEVERILGKRTRNNQVEYKVHWKGTAPTEDTWVPYEDFQDVDLIRKYHADELATQKTQRSNHQKNENKTPALTPAQAVPSALTAVLPSQDLRRPPEDEATRHRTSSRLRARAGVPCGRE
ncbi:hypothetical protein HDU67_004310, partial [Dinochytrium kinnereticum]